MNQDDFSPENKQTPLQVAGHQDIKYGHNNLVLIKKNRGFEVENYCKFFDPKSELRRISLWTPRFLGVLVREKSGPRYFSLNEILSEDVNVRPWNLCEAELCLENVIARFQLPCVVDIKIGRVFFNKLTDASKIDRIKRKCTITSSKSLGIFISGSSHWPKARDASATCYSIDEFASLLMKSLNMTTETVYHGNYYCSLVEDILDQLFAIESVLTTLLQGFSMISTSILLAYDKSHSKCHEGEDFHTSTFKRGDASVKIIDFSNCVPVLPHGFCDSIIGYHDGFLNLIESFGTIRNRLKAKFP